MFPRAQKTEGGPAPPFIIGNPHVQSTIWQGVVWPGLDDGQDNLTPRICSWSVPGMEHQHFLPFNDHGGKADSGSHSLMCGAKRLSQEFHRQRNEKIRSGSVRLCGPRATILTFRGQGEGTICCGKPLEKRPLSARRQLRKPFVTQPFFVLGSESP